MRTEILGRDEILGVATDSLGRQEILGSEDFVGRHHRNLQQIEQRAAGGNARAAAKLQRIQQRLQQRAAAGDSQATAKLQQIQTWLQQSPATAAALSAANPQASYLAPGQYGQPAYQPQYGQPAYPAPYSQYAQSQYVDPYSQYAQPQYAGQYAPQPTVDVYQGCDESGLEEILGASLPVKIAKKLVTAPIDAADWVARLVNRHAPSPLRMSFIGDETPDEMKKRNEAVDQYLIPAFKSKQITKADMVKYLNTVRPEVRSIAATNLVNTLKYSGVSIQGDDDRTESGKGAHWAELMRRGTHNQPIPHHVRGDNVFGDVTPDEMKKRNEAVDQYLIPAFKSKQITKADMVKYLNTVRPEVRSIAATNLVNTLKYSGVSIQGDDDRTESGKGAHWAELMRRGTHNQPIPHHVRGDNVFGSFVSDEKRELSGEDDDLGWGWGSIKRGLSSSITAPFKAVKYSFTVPYRGAKAYATGRQLKGASDLTHFSGDEVFGAFVGDEAREMSGAGAVEQEAASRGSCGYNGAWRNIRPVRSGAFVGDDLQSVADLKSKTFEANKEGLKRAWIILRINDLKKQADAGDEDAKKKLKGITAKYSKLISARDASSSDGAFDDADGRQAAKRILEDAAAQKSIGRDALKKAIWLWAGKTSTVRERADVGSKMIAFLNKRSVKLT